MINKFLILLTLFFISCSEEKQEIPATIVEEEKPIEEPFEYKTYKRITRLSNIEGDLLKKHDDLNGATRQIMNIYDGNKGTPPTSSETQE